MPPFPIKVELRAQKGKLLKANCMGEPVDHILKDGKIAIEMKMDSIWKTIRVDWKA